MAREVICGIYKITNLVNGKIYIGQSLDVYRRFSQHKKIGKSKNGYKDDRDKPLYRALRRFILVKVLMFIGVFHNIKK